jgi:hypothetical protein
MRQENNTVSRRSMYRTRFFGHKLQGNPQGSRGNKDFKDGKDGKDGLFWRRTLTQRNAHPRDGRD